MNRLKSIVLTMLAVATVVGFTVAPAMPVEAQGSAALSITPRKNYTIEPGKGVKDTLAIRNLDNERDLQLSLRVVDFTYTDDGGTPKLMLAEDAPQTTWSLKPFVDLAEEFVEIEAGGSKSVEVDVNVPSNQGAGSFYSAIVYSSGASEGGNVGLSASGVSLMFVTVPGEVDEKLTLEKLGAYDDTTRQYKRVIAKMPTRMAYTLNNEGNVVESPVGSITLRDLFGRETVINDINPNGSLALIGQTRTFESCIVQRSQEVDFNGSRQEATTCAESGLWPGFYRVKLDAYYGQNGSATHELNGSSWFFYLPWWFVIVSLIVLAFLAYHIWRFVRFVRNKRSAPKLKNRSSNK